MIDKTQFRKRTIKNKYDINIISNDVKFYTYDPCMECQTNINLNKLSRDFHNMRRDVLWATCPYCGSYLLPKIGVRLGSEVNLFNKLKQNTSSYEWIVLYSPYFLKYNYNNGLLKEFRIKLDVEMFKMRFNAIFWDSVWYFKIKDLDYEFMLPYEYQLDTINFEKVNSNLKINNMFKFSDNKKVIDNYFVNNIDEENIMLQRSNEEHLMRKYENRNI